MKPRYRLICRGNRLAAYYLVDTRTGKRTSLHTSDKDAAKQIVEAKNQAERQPLLNLQIAKAYLSGTDNGVQTRTWRDAIDALTQMKQGANQHRWKTVLRDKAFAPLWPKVIVETNAELLLRVLREGCVSTNIYLRRLHNFCVDMNWLPWPLIAKRQWPVIRFKPKRAITAEEHAGIMEREKNPERKAFYGLAWHLGASQSDLAYLQAEDVDWSAKIICFERQKVRWRNQQPPQIRFGAEVEAILTRCRKPERCSHIGRGGLRILSLRLSWPAERSAGQKAAEADGRRKSLYSAGRRAVIPPAWALHPRQVAAGFSRVTASESQAHPSATATNPISISSRFQAGSGTGP